MTFDEKGQFISVKVLVSISITHSYALNHNSFKFNNNLGIIEKAVYEYQ